MNTTNMSYQTMLLHGQRETQQQTAKKNAKLMQDIHTAATNDKSFILEPTQKSIKDTPRMSLFRLTARERLARHMMNDML